MRRVTVLPVAADVQYMRNKTSLLVSPPPGGPHEEIPSREQVDRYFDDL
jgi:hypothetical protein